MDIESGRLKLKSVLSVGLNHTSGLVYGRTVGAVCSHESPRGDRRCSKEESVPLFDFWYFWSRKSTPRSPARRKVTFPRFLSVKSATPVSRWRKKLFLRFCKARLFCSSRQIIQRIYPRIFSRFAVIYPYFKMQMRTRERI